MLLVILLFAMFSSTFTLQKIGLLYSEGSGERRPAYYNAGVRLGPLVSPEQADFSEARCEAFWRMKQGPRNNESLL